jgi:hypothetical protein
MRARPPGEFVEVVRVRREGAVGQAHHRHHEFEGDRADDQTQPGALLLGRPYQRDALGRGDIGVQEREAVAAAAGDRVE